MSAADHTSDRSSSQAASTSLSPAFEIKGALPEVSLKQSESGGTVKEVVETRREWARGAVAVMIVGALLIVIRASFGLMFSSRQIADIKEIVELLVAPVIVIVGAVTGFYFWYSGVNVHQGPE